MYSIQGLKTVGNALPKNLNKILKKGGHNYSSIVNNWTEIVGKKTSQICYPKSIKTNKELQEGLLTLNVNHGNQLDVEYSKQDIIGKINSFFGYTFIKNIKIALIDEKIKIQHRFSKNLLKNNKLIKKISEINNLNLRKKLDNLIKEFEQKNIK